MDLWDAMKARRSYRVFKPDPVPKDLLRTILYAGLEAPSSCNMQPWEFVVVSGKKRDELSQLLLKAFSARGANYDFGGKKTPYPPEILARRKNFFRELFQELLKCDVVPKDFVQEGTLSFYGAPVIILVFMDSNIGSRYLFDIGTSVQNILLAAQAQGLGTHLIGMILEFQKMVKETLHIPLQKKLVVGICLGFPDLENPINSFKPKREHLGQSVQWIGF